MSLIRFYPAQIAPSGRRHGTQSVYTKTLFLFAVRHPHHRGSRLTRSPWTFYFTYRRLSSVPVSSIVRWCWCHPWEESDLRRCSEGGCPNLGLCPSQPQPRPSPLPPPYRCSCYLTWRSSYTLKIVSSLNYLFIFTLNYKPLTIKYIPKNTINFY